MTHPAPQPSIQPLSDASLRRDNLRFSATGGISQNNRCQGFVPAFKDTETGQVYRSCFPDGRAAPVHLLTGLPEELFGDDAAPGGRPAIKASVVAGFLREQTFYTRDQAARATAGAPMH